MRRTKEVRLAPEHISIDGIARLPAATRRPGHLVVHLADTSLADAPSAPVHKHRIALPTGAGPEIAFRLDVPRADIPAWPLAASARLLFHDGTDLRAGDFTTTERRTWQVGQPRINLRLVRIKGFESPQ